MVQHTQTKMPKKTRKHLSINGLLKLAEKEFNKISDKEGFNSKISLKDNLMAGTALFSLKYPTLLAYESDIVKNKAVVANLHSVYNIDNIPSDTCMRERLDEVDPEQLRPVFKSLIKQAQRGKVLEDRTYLDGYHILSIDGTQYFESKKVHCDKCLIKKNKKTGKNTYYHQMVGAVLVHPEHREVLPLCPEPIEKQDGQRKNDCERNACKRLLGKIRKDFPKMKFLVVEDGLSSNAPHIRELEKHNMDYILGVKRNDHDFLFELSKNAPAKEYEIQDDTHEHKFRVAKNIPLNRKNWELEVTHIEYWEKNKKTGKTQYFSWVTNLSVTKKNVYKVMRAARARWRIENETFNTLKNQGYNFGHNFGHGKKNLSTVFAYLMFLAFSIDQIQQMACWLFQKAWENARTKVKLWEWIRSAFLSLYVDSMETIIASIAFGAEPSKIKVLYDSG